MSFISGGINSCNHLQFNYHTGKLTLENYYTIMTSQLRNDAQGISTWKILRTTICVVLIHD